MKNISKVILSSSFLLFAAVGLSACSPEVGSAEWCDEIKEKDKGDWSANEAAEFAKSCLFK